VYKANVTTGNTMDGPNTFESCNTDCSRFTWNGSAWVSAGGAGWAHTAMKACGSVGHTDYLGVYVRIRHDYFTGLFGSSTAIKDFTVMRLEPLPAAQGCE
jgi:hypothetical protein